MGGRSYRGKEMFGSNRAAGASVRWGHFFPTGNRWSCFQRLSPILEAHPLLHLVGPEVARDRVDICSPGPMPCSLLGAWGLAPGWESCLLYKLIQSLHVVGVSGAFDPGRPWEPTPSDNKGRAERPVLLGSEGIQNCTINQCGGHPTRPPRACPVCCVHAAALFLIENASPAASCSSSCLCPLPPRPPAARTAEALALGPPSQVNSNKRMRVPSSGPWSGWSGVGG